MQSKFIQPPFVGESRLKLVEGLVSLFDEINVHGEPRWISIEAPSGWGKTRVAQEFYARLAARQKQCYWPATILEASDVECLDVPSRRKRVFPDPHFFDRAPGALPEFMWWGIACEMRNGLPSQTLLEDLHQLHAHSLYLEAAWSILASFTEKRFPTLAAAKRAVTEILEEAASFGISELVEEIAKATVPGIGLVTKLGRWGISQVGESRKKTEILHTGGELKDGQPDNLLEDTVAMVSKIARPGLPVVVFVEDFHKATPLVEKLIEGLVRARAAFLIITTAWPGELEQRKQLKTLFSEEMLQSRILRIRHDGNMPASFPKGASMGELSEQDLRKVVLAYYPKADSETLERLASRYNNPLPLELVCTLPKYQKKFSDGALKLKPGEIDSLPNRVEDLYRELWNALPLIAKQALALSTLGIPDNDAIWDSSLIRRTIKKCDALDANDAIAEILEKDCIPHGWVRVIQSWLRRFNEPDQLHIARNYVGDHFFQEDIDRFLDHLADELEARTFDSAKPEAQNHARLVLFLHKDGKIEDIHALKAICFLLETLRTLPLELAECIKIGEYLKNLKVEENSNELMEGYANYAFALGEAGRLGEALQQFEALLPDQVRILGADHPRTLVTRNNIASLLAKSGRVEEALKQFEDLLRDKVQRLGANHPSTLTTRNNIATWLGESGQVEEALKQFKDLLRDEARLLGADHPSTLETRSNIAFGLGESGQVEEALKQFEDLLRDEIRILGADHPNTLATRHNIASWLGDSGRVEEALRQYEELLPDEVRILGADHSNTLSTRNNIASRLGELGRIEEALKQFEELLRDKLRILGADHPSTLATRHNMASWLGESGQVEESLKQFENLLRDELRIMGADHPRALATRSNIASCLGNSGRVDEALKQLEELLLDKLRILGADHPSTLTTRNNIAFWLVESGKEKEALIHFQKLLQDKLRIFGADHPSTLRTHRNMVKLTQKLP